MISAKKGFYYNVLVFAPKAEKGNPTLEFVVSSLTTFN